MTNPTFNNKSITERHLENVKRKLVSDSDKVKYIKKKDTYETTLTQIIFTIKIIFRYLNNFSYLHYINTVHRIVMSM